MQISDEQFERRKTEAEAIYKGIGRVRCPYFDGAEIVFNSDGFEHLIFKSWNRTRSREDQFVRFRLLRLVMEVLRRSGTLQEYEERMMFVRRQSSGKWNKMMKSVRYYAFVAIVDDVRLKVIIKEVDGIRRFHSVFPSWKVVSKDDGRGHKKLFSGDPEND